VHRARRCGLLEQRRRRRQGDASIGRAPAS
jgi:hypothetical protein